MEAPHAPPSKPREFPALKRLMRFAARMAIFGIFLVALGLALGLLLQAWAIAGGLLTGGAGALVLGLWGRRRARQAIDRLTKQHLEVQSSAAPIAAVRPALERLIHLYAWIAVFGGVLVASGLALGLSVLPWPLAGAMVAIGAYALAVGLWARRHAKQAVDRLSEH